MGFYSIRLTLFVGIFVLIGATLGWICTGKGPVFVRLPRINRELSRIDLGSDHGPWQAPHCRGCKERLLSLALFVCHFKISAISSSVMVERGHCGQRCDSSLNLLESFAWMIHSTSLDKPSLPDFIAFTIALGSFAALYFPAIPIFVKLSHFTPLWKQIQVILEEPAEEVLEKVLPGKLRGHIRFDQVSFRYDPQSPCVLKNLSLEIKPESLVGIVGPSGSGKSP